MKRLTLKQNIMEGIHALSQSIWKQEFRTTFRDQGVLIFFILVPLAYPLIYAFIYTNETIRDVPAVGGDESRSSLSREYLRRVDATPEVSIVSYCADMEEAKLAMKDRAGLRHHPRACHFSEDIAEGRQTHVQRAVDMSGLALLQIARAGQHGGVAGHERGNQTATRRQHDRTAGRNHRLPHQV